MNGNGVMQGGMSRGDYALTRLFTQVRCWRMGKRPIRRVMFAVSAAAAVTMYSAIVPVAGQGATTYRAPRTKDGRPDLNGFWQAVNTANYDVQAHVARPAMALRAGPYGPVPAAQVVALGAVGSVPAGLGVVESNEIPYKPEMAAKKKENQDNWLERDPEIKCYLPGVPRATYMPFPFQIFQSQSQVFIAYEYAGAVRNIYMKDPAKLQWTRGWASRSAGGKAKRWLWMSAGSTIRHGLIARVTSIARR